MLDAMVLLEKNGRTNGPQKSSYSTDYDQQEEYAEVKKTVYDEKREKQLKEREEKEKEVEALEHKQKKWKEERGGKAEE